MQRIFLSFHFNKPTDADQHDSRLADNVDALLRSHGLVPVTGENLGGGQLTPEIMRRIEGCDGLVALMTRRDNGAGGNGPDPAGGTHPWVVDELNHARGQRRRAIALMEDGVRRDGAYKENEYIPYDRAAPLAAFVRLSATIGAWKAEAGQTVPIQILPVEVAELLGNAGDKAECYYRLVVRGKPVGQYAAAPVYPEVGGTFIYAAGMTPDTMVQVKAVIGGQVYESRQMSQWLPVTLKKGGA